MTTIYKRSAIAISTILLSSCSSFTSCVPIYPYTAGEVDGKTYPIGVNVAINDERYFGGAYVSPLANYCGSLPDSITVGWQGSSDSDAYHTQKVSIRGKVPDGFMKNPARQIKVSVDEKDTVKVYFKTQLSNITTKYLIAPESPSEKHQRLLDEALWLAIQEENIEGIERLILQGANTIQPWMWKGAYYYDKALHAHAYQTQNAELISQLIDNEIDFKFLDRKYRSVLETPIRESNTALVSVFLADGHDPNLMYIEQTEYFDGGSRGPEKYREKLIYLAAEKGDLEIVSLLLDYGADVNFTTHQGISFLKWAQANTTNSVYNELKR